MRITREEIIQINQENGGDLVRENSLDYALERAKNTNKFRACAFLIRAIVIDHPFSDGNKRTAVYVCIHELGDCGDGKLSNLMVKVAKESSDINKIEKMLRRCYQRN